MESNFQLSFNRVCSVSWGNNNWALGCDFKGNDLSNMKSRGEDCSGICARTNGCTHFSWNTFENGTCWMKNGSVSKKDAITSTEKGIVCGIVNDNAQKGKYLVGIKFLTIIKSNFFS